MDNLNHAYRLPAASVIMPVYNAGKYLDEAIESVLGQSFADFELLLLNDGSTDGSAERLERIAALDHRCSMHSWPNRGLIATLNEGIRLARADILIRMDADDRCLPGRFAPQVAYLWSHPDCVAVGTQMMLIDPEGQPLRPFIGALAHADIDAAHLVGKGGAIAHATAAMRKAAVLRVGGYRAQFPHAEDIDLFLRLAEVGSLANLPDILYEYRQHLDSICHSHTVAQRSSCRRAVDEARLRRRLPPLDYDETFSPDISLAELHRKWGWWALGAGHLASARKHALRATWCKPFDIETLRLLACALRGY